MSQKEAFSAGQTREFYGDGDFFRLLETTASINVEFYYQGREIAEMIDIEAGYAESFAREQLRFDRIRIYSATAQDVKWVIREGSDVRYDRGAASITGSVDLNAATIKAEKIPLQPTGSYANVGALAVNTPVTLFTPGANVNGAILLTASISDATAGGSYQTSMQQAAFIAKNAQPANIADGEVIFQAGVLAENATYYHCQGQLNKEQYIAPGLGLYLIFANNAASAYAFKAARWLLL